MDQPAEQAGKMAVYKHVESVGGGLRATIRVRENEVGGAQPLPLHASSARYTPPADQARYNALVAKAVDVFGDDLRASIWLSTPSADLNGEVPLRVAQMDNYSLERFEPIFNRIEHGIDS